MNTISQNKNIVTSFIDALFTKGDLGAVDEYLAGDYVDHDPPMGFPASREGMRAADGCLRRGHAAGPDGAGGGSGGAGRHDPAARPRRAVALHAPVPGWAAGRRRRSASSSSPPPRQIVDEWHISANTVQEHLTAAFDKFGVRSRRELVAAMLTGRPGKQRVCGHPPPAGVPHGARICGQPLTMDSRSVGVEEEFLLIEPDTGRPKAVAGTVLQAAGPEGGTDLEGELQQQQLETNSRPCQSLEELHRELRRCRAAAAMAAGRAGAQVVALGTSPLPVEPQPLSTSRYERMAELFGLTAHEQLTCGCHVHVRISDADEGVAVLDRAGPWLATLLALSANSPFWQGRDSEYASFRYQVWGRWPSSGPTGPFGTSQAYRETIEQMVGSGTLIDPGMVYFDARLSERYPTVEIRIADVCLRAEDAVLVAALARALVETEARSWREGKPASPARTELLRLAAWRASRTGLDDTLVHPVTGKPEPATTVVGMLIDHCRDALSDTGDADTVAGLLTDLLARGNGASFQRSAYRRSGRLPEVISSAVEVTGLAG